MVKIIFMAIGFYLSVALLPVFSFESSQAMLDSPHYQPGQGWDSWSLQFGYFISDFDLEEETQNLDLDDIDSEYFHITLGWMYGLRSDLMWFGAISHVDFGDRSRTYADDINLPNMTESFKGLSHVDLGLQKRFTQHLDQGIEQSAVVKIRTQPFTAKDTNASLGGTNASAHYLYTFYHSWGEINGSIDAYYYGTKRLKRVDGEKQKTKPYSDFGFTIGAKRKWKTFYLGLTTGFGLTTDYIISSPSYNRAANNGYNYLGQLILGWSHPTYLIELVHSRRSDVFNKEREASDGEIDYENESEHTTLRFLWPF